MCWGNTMGALLGGPWGGGGGRARCPRGNRVEIWGGSSFVASPAEELARSASRVALAVLWCRHLSRLMVWCRASSFQQRGWAGAAWLFGPAVLPRCPLSPVLRDFCPCRGVAASPATLCAAHSQARASTRKKSRTEPSLCAQQYSSHCTHTHTQRMCCIEASSSVVLGQGGNPG